MAERSGTEKPYMGRVRDDLALKKLVSGRVGLHDGRKARTFHSHVRGIKVGAGTGAIDYLAREEDYNDREDLEYLSGDTKRLKEVLAAIDKNARIRKGKCAETVLKTQVFELPADSTAEARKAVADAIVKRWTDRGYAAVAAIHCDDVQPHAHLAVASRRAQMTADGLSVDRTSKSVAMQYRSDIRQERKAVAELINAICNPEITFFAGRDNQMDQPGITGRKPKRRIPQHDYHEDGVRRNASVVIEERHQQHEAQRKASQESATLRQQEREDKRQAKLERLKGVDAGLAERWSDFAHKQGVEEGRSEIASAMEELKLATVKQRELILALANEAGVKITEEDLQSISGGSLIAAVKLARTRGTERLTQERDKALERARRAETALTATGADRPQPATPPAAAGAPIAGKAVWLHPRPQGDPRDAQRRTQATLDAIRAASPAQLTADRTATAEALAQARQAGNDGYRITALAGGLKALDAELQARSIRPGQLGLGRPGAGQVERG